MEKRQYSCKQKLLTIIVGKYYSKKNYLLSLVLALMLCMSLALPVWAVGVTDIDYASEISKIRQDLAVEQQDINYKSIQVIALIPIETDYLTQESAVDLTLITNNGIYPVKLLDDVQSAQLRTDELSCLLNRALNQNYNIANSDYELIVYSDDLSIAYDYQKINGNEQIFVLPLSITSEEINTGENNLIMPLAGSLSDAVFSPGYGCRALSFDSSITAFTAKFYSTSHNILSGSSNVGLCNYIGYSVSGQIEADLGTMYSTNSFPTLNSSNAVFSVKVP